MSDGSELETTVEHPYGTPNNPMSDDALDDKYRRCAGDVFDGETVESSLSTIRDIENVDHVGDLLDELTA
jgi:2-methylcitrate dehydratase